MKWEYIDNDTIRIRANSSGGNYSVTGDFSLLGDAAQRPILLNHGSKTTACGSFITWDELTAAGWSISETELCRFCGELLTHQNIEKPRLPLWKQTGFVCRAFLYDLQCITWTAGRRSRSGQRSLRTEWRWRRWTCTWERYSLFLPPNELLFSMDGY